MMPARLQAKKLEDIRSEAQAELGIVPDMPIAGLEVLSLSSLSLPASLPPLAAKRPEEVDLFPGGWVGG